MRRRRRDIYCISWRCHASSSISSLTPRHGVAACIPLATRDVTDSLVDVPVLETLFPLYYVVLPPIINQPFWLSPGPKHADGTVQRRRRTRPATDGSPLSGATWPELPLAMAGWPTWTPPRASPLLQREVASMEAKAAPADVRNPPNHPQTHAVSLVGCTLLCKPTRCHTHSRSPSAPP